VRKHRGLCDRNCPKCGKKNVVHWKSNLLTIEGEKAVEFDYFICEACGWRSEYHETLIEFGAGLE
jgi:C4-type Zn-finger protein